MLKLIAATFVAVFVIAFSFTTAHAAIVSTTIDCASVNDGYTECETGLVAITQATLVSENIAGSCTYGSTWGTYNALVWVNHGCSGRFAVNADKMNPPLTPVPTPAPTPRPPAYSVVDCRWNSVNWQPYYRPDGHFVGRANYGFVDSNTCVAAVQMSRANAICNWTGNGFTPYDIETNVEVVYASFPSLQICYDQIR